MFYFAMWTIFWAVVGSFGTAFFHERTGRDVTMGGIIGGLVGAVGGIFLLALLWVWIYYGASRPVGRVYGPRRKLWYRWWE
ncbi:MAG: hypothetical protein K8L97_16565 [Anaerolineae bacterium]|nr:hypothetical protein [Anaerolineae bacterium]